MQFIELNSDNIKYQLQHLRQLVFEVTDRCNLNCKYCIYSDLYNKEYDQRDGKNISFGKAKLVIDYFFKLWGKYQSDGVNEKLTISFYGGEPLLNVPFIQQAIDYVERLEKVGKVYSYSMTTNAILLDKYMDYLVEKNFRLLISLDGDEFAQSYRINHSGQNSFERVFRNVKLLKDTHPDYFKKRISFHSVLHNRNDIESIYLFFKEHFDKIPRIMPLNTSGVSNENKEEFRNMFLNPTESIINSTNCEAIESELMMKSPRISRLARYIFFQSKNCFNSYNDLFINKDDLDFQPTGTCIPFSKKIFITVNGKILPCERIDHCFSLGQVYDDHVSLNEDYVAERHNYFVSKYRKQCVNCGDNRFCMQCVYQISDIQKDTTSCPSFLSQKDLDNKNKKTLDILLDSPQYYRRILEEVVIKS
jgi:uncharacterized protein